MTILDTLSTSEAPVDSTVLPSTGLSGFTETTYHGVQGRVLDMLGNGLAPEIVSTALGITPGYVSQMLQEESFVRQVTERRYINLQAATKRDRSYDSLEDELLGKMADMIPIMYKPELVLRAIAVLNAAKRRGATASENTVINNTIVQLTLPSIILSRIVKNADNQVIEAGEQQLITAQSNSLTDRLNTFKKLALPNRTNDDERTDKSQAA